MIDFGCVCNNAITLYECDPALNTACMHKWCAVDHPDDPKSQRPAAFPPRAFIFSCY